MICLEFIIKQILRFIQILGYLFRIFYKTLFKLHNFKPTLNFSSFAIGSKIPCILLKMLLRTTFLPRD